MAASLCNERAALARRFQRLFAQTEMDMANAYRGRRKSSAVRSATRAPILEPHPFWVLVEPGPGPLGGARGSGEGKGEWPGPGSGPGASGTEHACQIEFELPGGRRLCGPSAACGQRSVAPRTT